MRSLLSNLFNPWDDFFAPTYNKATMQSDVIERDNEFEIVMDLAGYEKEQISLNLEKDVLTISAQKQEKEENEKYLFKERSVSCQRSFKVGFINKDAIKASYVNGVLSIIIPKEQEKLDTKILIS